MGEKFVVGYKDETFKITDDHKSLSYATASCVITFQMRIYTWAGKTPCCSISDRKYSSSTQAESLQPYSSEMVCKNELLNEFLKKIYHISLSEISLVAYQPISTCVPEPKHEKRCGSVLGGGGGGGASGCNFILSLRV